MIAEPTRHLRKTIAECFKDDEALLSTFHIEAGNGFDRCVERTVMDLYECDDLEFYKLTNDAGEVIGFFGRERMFGLNFLTSFCIKPQHRNEETLDEFWKIVKETFKGRLFFSGIYKRNLRAAKFLEKRGGEFNSEMQDKHGNDFLVYVFQ